MKKFVLIVCISLFGFYLSGQEVITLSIEKIDSKSLSKGDNVSIKIKLDKTTFQLSSFQLYIKYDPSVLQYQKTVQVSDLFSENWHDNDNVGLYAALYVDMKQTGFEVPENILICELEFKYLGGSTDLMFGTENIREKEILINGETKLTDLLNNNMPLNLINGCICNFE